MRFTYFFPLSLVALFPMIASCPSAAAPATSSLRLRPGEVALGLTYHGTTVHAEGDAPQNCDLVLVCSGAARPLTLKKKEKALGLLWLNRGELHFNEVPELYLLQSSAPLDQLATPETLAQWGVGQVALQQRALPGQPQIDGNHWFGELLKLKQRDELYSFAEQSLSLRDAPPRVHWSAALHFPANLCAGEYEVRLLGFRNGAASLLASQALRAQHVGAVATIHTVAHRHGLLYGIAAVLIALAVGLATGFAFGLGSKGGH